MMRSLHVYFGSLDRPNLDRRLKSGPILSSQIVVLTLIACFFVSPIPLDADAVRTVLRWQEDETLSGKQHGARGMWRDNLWGFSFDTGETWAYDGQQFLPAGKMPGRQRPLMSLFTDDGIFVVAPSRHDGVVTADVLFSPDGFADYQLQLSLNSTTSGTPFASAQDHSLVDLGDSRLLFFEYSDESRVFYSGNAGQNWDLLFEPDSTSIRHFHGAFFDPDYEKLYVMSGDSNAQSSIMVTDDLFGEHGLINDPGLWRTRWGMDDPGRKTLETEWLLKPLGLDRSQHSRSVEMEIDGDYVYWGEDTGRPSGQKMFRAHRQTMEVEEVGSGGIIGSPWRFLKTSDDRFLFLTSAIHWQGELFPGSDEFLHLYEMTEDGSDYRELARFSTLHELYSGSMPFGFAEAFERLWINGYNISDPEYDVVGSLIEVGLGDLNDDEQLTAIDIDLLSAAIRNQQYQPIFDLDMDGRVDGGDRDLWVNELKDSFYGDCNLDGEFSSDDLTHALQFAEYEDDLPRNSGWAAGDWNGDGDFTSADLVLAFEGGAYEQGPRVHAAVPEPRSWTLLVVALVGILLSRQIRAACVVS